MLRSGLIFLLESRAAKRLVTGTPLSAMSRRFVPGDTVDELVSAIRKANVQRLSVTAKSSLLADGYNVRVYIPFGEAWYPFLMRRLAERPANVLFMEGSVVWESPLGFLWPNKSRRNDA